MEALKRSINLLDLSGLAQAIQSGAVDHIDEKEEEDFKYVIINLVNGIQFASENEKTFSRKALAAIIRRSPDHSEVYNIPAIMAGNYKQMDVVLALMLKGGSPSAINPNFFKPFLNRNNEGVSPLLKEIAELESSAHQAGKSFRQYAEEQRKSYSLEEVLARLENQSGGRRRPRRHRTHRKKGSRRSRK